MVLKHSEFNCAFTYRTINKEINMFIRIFTIAALVMTGFAASNAQAEGFIRIEHEPEAVISVTNGARVWVPGYWEDDGHHRSWVAGYWERPVYRQQYYSQQPYVQQYYRQQYNGNRGHRGHHSRKCG